VQTLPLMLEQRFRFWTESKPMLKTIGIAASGLGRARRRGTTAPGLDRHRPATARLPFLCAARSVASRKIQHADGGRAMRFGAGIGSIMLLAVVEAASAQPFPDPSTLDATQLRGRDIFNQSCLVCHVKLQITSPAKYGPDLSKEALGGQEAVMRDVISNGTPNMPGFKYTYEPAQIDAIIAYVKTLPTPAKPNPAPNPTR
jgi:mono/diheme cytochrome c family protein